MTHLIKSSSFLFCLDAAGFVIWRISKDGMDPLVAVRLVYPGFHKLQPGIMEFQT